MTESGVHHQEEPVINRSQEFPKRRLTSTLIVFFSGVVAGWLFVLILGSIWFVVTDHQMQRRLDAKRVQFQEENAPRGLTLPIPEIRLAENGPEFDFSWHPFTVDGSQIDFHKYEGSTVILSTFATWCQPCKAELRELEKLERTLGQAGSSVHVFIVSTEEDEKLEGFFGRGLPNIPIILGHKSLPAVLWSKTLPTTFLIAPDGRIRYQHMGAAAWSSPAVIDAISKVAASKRRED